jgi:hypothetical protein
MRFPRLLYEAGKLAVLTTAYWLAMHGNALAQPGMPTKPEPGSGQYVMSYFLVIMGVAVGLLVVCRASNRRDRAKPEGYDETRVNIKDE